MSTPLTTSSQPARFPATQPGGEGRDDQPADPDRRPEHTDARSVHVESVGCDEHVHHLFEAEKEDDRRGEGDQRHESRVGSNDASPVDDLSADGLALADSFLAAVTPDARPSADVADAQQQHGRHRERQSVEHEGDSDPADGDGGRAERWAQEEGDLSDDALGGVGRGEVLLVDERRRRGHDGGAKRRRGHRAQHGDADGERG